MQPASDSGQYRFDTSTWKRFIAIAKPFFVGSARWKAWGLLGLLIGLSVTVSGMNVLQSYVNRDFTTALALREESKFYTSLSYYVLVLCLVVPVAVFYRFTEERLALVWRRWLSKHLIDKYFSERAYYSINWQGSVDNPDQRISDEVRAFTATSLSFLLIIFNSCITLFSFLGLLWSISSTLSLVVIGYAFVGSVITLSFGKRLVGLNFTQLRREADFRYGLIHVRDNAESIAFYRGEERESKQVMDRFRDAIVNALELIRWHRNLNFFTTGYNYLVGILPTLVVAPLYFSGKVEFGVVTQATFAFGHVVGALSLMVVQFERLTSFAADIARLGSFWEELERAHAEARQAQTLITEEGAELRFEDVTVRSPDGRALIQNINLTLSAGHGLLVTGQSGSGKSSLLRTIAGLWQSGSGRMVRPASERLLFLPQRPYMVLGTLRDQFTYLDCQSKITDDQILEVLKLVKFEDVLERTSGFNQVLDWSNIFSLGEQQRIAFARMFLGNYDIVFLDEATSALDIENEAYLYKLLMRRGCSYVSVGHRPSLYRFHHSVVKVDGKGGWSFESCDTYERPEDM
jgi:vitamin B12/bleomycin/antimicrobial peptide transport system ATP-binding/permease protein